MTVTPEADLAIDDAILESKIESILKDKLDHYLADIRDRIEQAMDVERGPLAQRKVYAEDLMVKDRVYMTGYTLTPNTPAGSYAWADLHMVYNGVDYAVTNGSSNKKYTWWSPITGTTGTTSLLQSSDVKPTLAAGEVLLFMMTSPGIAKVMVSDTNSSLPTAIGDATVDAGAILANAVTSTALADGALARAGQLGANVVTAGAVADGTLARAGQLAANVVTTGKIADGAISRSGILGTDVVTATAVQANAISAGKIADGAISRSGILGTDVVTATSVAPNAVTAAKLADGAVVRSTQLAANVVTATSVADGAVARSGQLASNVVTAPALADGAVARAGQLAANVVTTTQLANNAVTFATIANGAVQAANLNIARHVLY